MTGQIAVVPARGGSKRLPRKNVAPLGGKPMLVHTVLAALRADIFDAVLVATEDDEISAVAEQAGATVPGRMPLSLAGDLVSSTAAALWAVDAWEAAGGHAASHLHVLQPSSPLRSEEDLRGARAMLDAGWDHVISVTPIDPHYFHWALKEQEGAFRMYFGEDFLIERPLLPPVYRPNGAIKASRLEELRRDGHILKSDRLAGYVMPEERSVHVATEFDLLVAAAVLERGGADHVGE